MAANVGNPRWVTVGPTFALGSPFQDGERCADPVEEDFDECSDAFVEAMVAEAVRVAQSRTQP